MRKLLDIMFDWVWGKDDGFGPQPLIREDHAGFTDDELLAEYAEMQTTIKENDDALASKKQTA